MSVIKKLKEKEQYGTSTLGEWKDLFDQLVKEHGRDTVFDFKHDSTGDYQGLEDISDDMWEFEVYSVEKDDYTECNKKYIRIVLDKLN